MISFVASLIIIGLIALLAGLMYFIWKDAQKRHKELDEIESKINTDSTLAQLKEQYSILEEVSKKCWGEPFSKRIIKIKTTIEVMYQMRERYENEKL